MTPEPCRMRIYVTHDDGAEAAYDVLALRVNTPVAVAVEYSQLVLSAGSEQEAIDG